MAGKPYTYPPVAARFVAGDVSTFQLEIREHQMASLVRTWDKYTPEEQEAIMTSLQD